MRPRSIGSQTSHESSHGTKATPKRASKSSGISVGFGGINQGFKGSGLGGSMSGGLGSEVLWPRGLGFRV